jgi:lipopolysaccharide/colanic/teichoic acid biosynthesis glycosyltransferase
VPKSSAEFQIRNGQVGKNGATKLARRVPSSILRDGNEARTDWPVPPLDLHPVHGWYTACKRAGDLASTLVLLASTAPLLLFAAIVIKLSSRGPVLYSQVRLGRNDRPFTLYKLRTMIHKCESLTGARWSVPGDPRITPVGRFLRRSHLDELPQLWNVLRGEMSLVGPRPERPEFVPQLEQAIPRYRHRLLVRPGLTGLAQVQLPPDTDLESVGLKLAYDLYYVDQVGCWLDFRLLVGTALKIVGVPFGGLRRILGLATRETIIGSYRRTPEVMHQRALGLELP